MEFFQQALPDQSKAPFVVEDCTIEAGHYGRQHRCVLRYEVASRLLDTAVPVLPEHGLATDEAQQLIPQVIYGKVAADDRCKIVGAVLTSLHWRLNRVQTKRKFRIPNILGYWPKTGLILLEAIPGKPQISELLQARITGTEEADAHPIALSEALHDCASVAVALHKVDIKFSETRTFQAELDDLQALMSPVRQFSLALDMQLQHTVRRLHHYAATTEALPICFSHGDYTYTQLIFDDRSCGLVDFDTVCQAEPALDLGQFLAYMRLAARKAEYSINAAGGVAVDVDVDALATDFINTYIQMAGHTDAYAQQLRARVAAYEVISLMRITLHSWQKMKSGRLEIATGLLEERTAALRV